MTPSSSVSTPILTQDTPYRNDSFNATSRLIANNAQAPLLLQRARNGISSSAFMSWPSDSRQFSNARLERFRPPRGKGVLERLDDASLSNFCNSSLLNLK